MCIQTFRDQDPPHVLGMKKHVCAQAPMNGHLHVLKWAPAQDSPCSWDEKTCANAATNRHLHVLLWLRSQDPICP